MESSSRKRESPLHRTQWKVQYTVCSRQCDTCFAFVVFLDLLQERRNGELGGVSLDLLSQRGHGALELIAGGEGLFPVDELGPGLGLDLEGEVEGLVDETDDLGHVLLVEPAGGEGRGAEADATRVEGALVAGNWN